MTPLRLRNGETAGRDAVPVLPLSDFGNRIARAVNDGSRLSALFAHEGRLFALLANEQEGVLEVSSSQAGSAYPSLTPECAQAQAFERDIFEGGGPRPEGHPWLKPLRGGHDDFFQVTGDEVHEVAVGPVHAGVIEPGHFRFQCHGERVLHLEIALGYQHRGVEAALAGGPHKRTFSLMETLAGDTTIGHATAYAQALESLSGTRIPARAQALRGVALELERLANHAGDLGALAGDVGYLPTASYCGRLRGDFLNLTALLCGNRFGRGLVRPGGVGFDAEPERIRELLDRLKQTLRDMAGAVGLLWKSASAMTRFEDTGVLSRDACLELGLVGPAARACGVERDVRHDFPAGIFHFAQIPVSTAPSGDVFARAFVRWLEIQRSADFVRDQLENLPPGEVRVEAGPLIPNRICASLVEGWRGEVCHVALTDGQGRFARYKVVDPSFHNWFGLALALRGQEISDFPLCNKSFNLSYCGHDL